MPTFVQVEEVGGKSRFSVGLNVVVTGSKDLDQGEKEVLEMPAAVRVVIVDASDEGNVLVDEVVPAKLFKPGKDGRQSCGYGLQARDRRFGE